MRFVLVNDRVPRESSICARCGALLATGYVRNVSSRRSYCGYACCTQSDDLAGLSATPGNSGLVGLPKFGQSS
jgi:hypothetical protein